ncbi:hypothetical protein B0O80DRAFT_466053, partial [Mortierella sp. GBAus27b]
MGIPVDRYIGTSRPRPTHSAKPSWSESSAPIDYPLSILNPSMTTQPARRQRYQDNIPLSALAFAPPPLGVSPAAPPPAYSPFTRSDDTRSGSGATSGRMADIESPTPSRTPRAHPSLRRVTRSPAFVASPSTTTSRHGADAAMDMGIELQSSSNLWPSQWRPPSTEIGRSMGRDTSSLTSHLTRSPDSTLTSIPQRNEQSNTTSGNYRLVNTNHVDNRNRVDASGRIGAARLQRNPPYDGTTSVAVSASSTGTTTVQQQERESERRTPSPPSASSAATPLPPFLQGLPNSCRTVVRSHPVYQQVVQIFPEDHEPVYMYGRPARPTSALSPSTTISASDFGVPSSSSSTS